MALNNPSARIIGRSGGGNAVKSAAYIDRARYQDERTGVWYDFRSKGGLEFSGVFAPTNTPDWMKDAATLANAIERTEDRSTRPHDAQLFRELILPSPHELTAEQRRWAATDWARELSRQGFVVHVANHAPDQHSDKRNFHTHAHISLREVTPDGFGKKFSSMTKTRAEWQQREKQQLEKFKERWSELHAKQLRRAGHSIEAERFRVGHFTNEKQAELATGRGDHDHAAGLLSRKKQEHMGPTVAAMSRKGIETDRGSVYRDTKARNAEIQVITLDLAQLEKLKQQAEREWADQIKKAAIEKQRGTQPPPQREDIFAGIGTPVSQQEAERLKRQAAADNRQERKGPPQREDIFAGIGTPVSQQEAERLKRQTAADNRQERKGPPPREDIFAGIGTPVNVSDIDRHREQIKNQNEREAERYLARAKEPGAQPPPQPTTTQARADVPRLRPMNNSGPWVSEQGGYYALSTEQQRHADISFDRWKEKRGAVKGGFDIDAYVTFVQNKWREEGRSTTFARLPAARSGRTPAAPNLAKAGKRIIGGALGALGKLADGFSLDGLTPKEKFEAAKRDHRNEREAEQRFDAAAFIAERAKARQDEQQREEEHRQRRQQDRDRDR